MVSDVSEKVWSEQSVCVVSEKVWSEQSVCCIREGME